MEDQSAQVGFAPVHVVGAKRTSRWLVTCDHASNVVPPDIGGGSLGLPHAEMARHIAFDLGAAGLAKFLAERLDAPCVLGGYSRLVIDPNRGEDDPTLIMKLYDGTLVPGNAGVDAVERARRIDVYYRPYHATLADLAARRSDTIIVAVHSFTPRLKGRGKRPWHVGLLSAEDRRLSDPMLAGLRAEGDVCVGDNEPYAGHLPGDAVDRHALQPGRPNVLIELRHDLIADDRAQEGWAARLAPILESAAGIAGV